MPCKEEKKILLGNEAIARVAYEASVKNIMIVGLGGQGTLLTSRILGNH